MHRRAAAVFVTMLLLVWLLSATQVPAQSEEVKTVRIGLQAGGTFAWVLHAFEYFGIDDDLGVRLETSTYATKQATELALRAGDIDVIVDDFVMVALMRDRGVPVRAVHPYSLATGGVVLPVDSPIQTVSDLKGKTVAAASLGDKSLLILRALTSSQFGFDPQVDGETIAVAPPLMAELLARGDIDAAIPYWHFVARMVGSGEYRELVSVTDMLGRMGLPTDLPILVVVARDDTDPQTLRTFLKGLVAAKERMLEDNGIWDSILANELYRLPDPSLMADVRARWAAGLPQRWNEEIINGLVSLVEAMVAAAGPELVGLAEIDTDAFALEFTPFVASPASEKQPANATAELVNPFHGDEAAIAEGQRLWMASQCFACHGTRGGGGMGPSLVDGRWRYGGDDASVFRTIKEGTDQGMPAWRDHLTDEQIWKIIAFIRSLEKTD